MKHTLLSLSLLFVGLSVFAQSSEIDSRIVAAYGESKVQWMSENAPLEIERLQDILLYAYDLIDVTSANSNKINAMPKIVVADIESMNVLIEANAPIKNQPQFFHLTNQNLILRVKSNEEFESDRNLAKKN